MLVLTGGGGFTEVFVLDIPPWLALQLGHVLALLGHVLDEHLLHTASVRAVMVLSPHMHRLEPRKIREAIHRKNLARGGERTVANVMTNTALFEHSCTSGSTAMVFLTLVTVMTRISTRPEERIVTT